MESVKKYLQSFGIAYIDWHAGNIGVTSEGTFKLFDFNFSAIRKINSEGILEWSKECEVCYAYRDAISAGVESLFDIDNYVFTNFFGKM